MNYKEQSDLDERAKEYEKKHPDAAAKYPWMLAADFAEREIDRERRRVRRAKAKKARKR